MLPYTLDSLSFLSVVMVGITELCPHEFVSLCKLFYKSLLLSVPWLCNVLQVLLRGGKVLKRVPVGLHGCRVWLAFLRQAYVFTGMGRIVLLQPDRLPFSARLGLQSKKLEYTVQLGQCVCPRDPVRL